jgi:hypothetical protein
MRQINFSLLTLTTILAISLSAQAQSSVAQTTNTGDLIGAGASIINGLLNPPSRSAEINADAEVKKAKIAAEAEVTKEKLRIEATKNTDRVTPVLNQWGVSRVACGQGLVFINGITTDTVCIKPSNAMAAGYYTYDSAKQQLVRDNSSSVQTNNNAQPPSNNNAQPPSNNNERNTNNAQSPNNNNERNTNNTQSPNNNNERNTNTQTISEDRNNNVHTIQNTQTTRVSNQNRSRSDGF